jgi:hypothetical protein
MVTWYDTEEDMGAKPDPSVKTALAVARISYVEPTSNAMEPVAKVEGVLLVEEKALPLKSTPPESNTSQT